MGFLASWVGKSAGTAVGSTIKETLGGVGTLAKDIRTALTGKDATKEAEIELKAQEIEALAQQGQVAINIEEAKSASFWVAGWRPFIGWVCGFSMGCYFVPQYIMATVIWTKACWTAKEILAYPIAQPEGLIELLIAMLGLGALRTYEKTQDAEKNR